MKQKRTVHKAPNNHSIQHFPVISSLSAFPSGELITMPSTDCKIHFCTNLVDEMGMP